MDTNYYELVASMHNNIYYNTVYYAYYVTSSMHTVGRMTPRRAPLDSRSVTHDPKIRDYLHKEESSSIPQEKHCSNSF